MTVVHAIGRLEWAIKDTFLAYLDAIGDTAVTTADGTERLGDGTLRFPVAVADDHRVEAAGSVLITAHGGGLSLEISRPALRREADGSWTLGWTAAGIAATRVRLLDGAAARPAGEHGVWRIADVALTGDGAELFGGSYGPWTRMAPISVFLD